METYYQKTFDGIRFENIDDLSVQQVIEKICESKKNSNNNRDDLDPVLISNYIREIWIGESPPSADVNTCEIVDLFIEGCEKPNNITDKQWNMISNLHEAIQYVYLDNVCSNNPAEYFNVDFAKKIHGIVGKNIINELCVFRTKRVGAKCSTVIYAIPSTIENLLRKLFDFVAKAVENAPENEYEKCEYMIRLGSFFFSEFLLIHPFINGNGRTARILLNALLKNTVVIPFSLYFKNRESYIEVLEKRNFAGPPSALAQHILLACCNTAACVNWLSLQ